MSREPKPARGRHETRRLEFPAPLAIVAEVRAERFQPSRLLPPLTCLLSLLGGCEPPEQPRTQAVAPPVVAGRVAIDDEASAGNAAVPFTLLDQTGGRFSSADLAGKVWLGSIFFSNCPGPCFRENQAIAEILRDIDDPGLVAVSLTCDPENDTPDVLRRYADRFEADPARWKFLTGDLAVIKQVGQEMFRLPVELGVHSERGVVFDRRGRLRGGYHLLQQDRLELLKKLIRDVLAEPSDGTVTQPSAGTAKADALDTAGRGEQP